MLMLFIATMNNKAATKNRTTNIKTIESADVATCFANRGAQTTKGAGHIVELTIKSDRKSGVREGRHMTLYATDFASAKLHRPNGRRLK
jgi:uncharacterized protein YceH (UPF0502 family)